MAPIILHSPFELPWQTVVFDALMLTLFVAAVAHAVLWHRRGVRIYSFVLIAGLVYGMVLELAGMATLNMYVQGDFPVMINFPALPLFAGTTAMPLYVTLFYPVIFTMGFLVVEALGIPSHWRAALTGGLFMIFLDAPYIIEEICGTSSGGRGTRISCCSSTGSAGRWPICSGSRPGGRPSST